MFQEIIRVTLDLEDFYLLSPKLVKKFWLKQLSMYFENILLKISLYFPQSLQSVAELFINAWKMEKLCWQKERFCSSSIWFYQKALIGLVTNCQWQNGMYMVYHFSPQK